MRRAGYKVWLIPDLMGSWEEVPSNIIDFAARDRRWAQGNLQHMRVLIMPRLHWLNRLHMITGILSYVDLADVVRGAGAELHHHLPGGDPGLPVLRVRHAHAVSGVARVPRRGDRRAAAGDHRRAAAAEGARRHARADARGAPPRLRRRPAAADQPAAGAALQHAAGAADDGVSHHLRADHPGRQAGDLECPGSRRSRRDLRRCARPPPLADPAGHHLGRRDPEVRAALHLVDDAGARRTAAVGLPDHDFQPRGCGPGAAPHGPAADAGGNLTAAGAGR